MTFLFKLLLSFLLFPNLLLLCFDLLIKLSSLLSSFTLFLISLLLSLSRGKVVSRGSLLTSLSRALIFISRLLLLAGSLAELLVLINFLNTIIEGSIPCIFFVSGIIISIFRSLLLLFCWLRRLARGQAGKFTELSVADATICIVIASAQDGFDVFSTREEAIALEVVDQVRHGDALVALCNRFKSSYFDEVLAVSKLSLAVITLPLKLHFFVQKSGEKGEDFVGNGCRGSEVRRESPCGCNMAKVGVRRGQHQLTELIEVKHAILRSIILAHDILNVAHARVQELLRHKVVELVDANFAAAIPV